MCSTWYRVRRSLKSDDARNRSIMFSVGIPMFTRKVVRVNLAMWDKWRPFWAASYRAVMHGGKASLFTVFGMPSISAWLIFSIVRVFSFSAMSAIFWGSFGSSPVSRRFSMWRLTSSLRSLAVSVFVK